MAGSLGRIDIEQWFKHRFDHADGWNSSSISSLLNHENLDKIQLMFPDFPTRTKLKTLLSILHLGPRTLNELKEGFESLLELALSDAEESVCGLAEIIKPFLSTRTITSELNAIENQETAGIFERFSAEISAELEKVHGLKNLIPEECYYLNKNALESTGGEQGLPEKHFQLKGKSKAEILRETLIAQEGIVGMLNGKDVTREFRGVSASRKRPRPVDEVDFVPTRVRGMPRRVSASIPRRTSDNIIIGLD